MDNCNVALFQNRGFRRTLVGLKQLDRFR